MSGFQEWEFHFDLFSIEKESYCEFESKLHTRHEHIVRLLEDGFIIQSSIQDRDNIENHDDELRNLVERNKQIKQKIDVKLEELSRQQFQYENYKKDQKLLSQEIKETHEAFLMAKKYYKKFLKMYFTIESRHDEKQTIFIQFFTESKKDSEKYSIRLLRDPKTGCYELLNTIPKLPIHKELERRLKESNDVPGALCCIRQAFIIIKANKKK